MSYGKFAEYLQDNSGLAISGNEFSDIAAFAEVAPGGFYAMYNPCFKYSNEKMVINRNYLGALAIAGKNSVENDKYLWIMLSTADTAASSGGAPNAVQLTWEIWSAYTFGAKKVIFQSYEALKNDTELFTAAQKAITDIKALAPIYSSYTYIGIHSKDVEARSPKVPLNDETILTQIPHITSIDADGAVLFGLFAGEKGSALMLLPANTEELISGAFSPKTVTLTLDGTEKTVTAYIGGEATLLSGANGVYTVELAGPEGVFVTVE